MQFELKYIPAGRFNGHQKELNFQKEEMELGNDQQLKVQNNMGIRLIEK